MRSKEYNSTIGATAGCTVRLAKLAHPVVEGEPKATVEGDAWLQEMIQMCPSSQNK